MKMNFSLLRFRSTDVSQFRSEVDWTGEIKSSFRLCRALVLMFFFFCALSFSLCAAVYYVSPIGNDTNPGIGAQPWRTIQKAANTVAAGDIVYVQPGIYHERVQCTSASGNAASPISFVANGAVTNYGWYFNKPYYTVQGFTVTGSKVPSNQGTFSVMRPAHGSQIISNIIAHTSDVTYLYGVWLEHGEYGIRPSNCVIRANQILEPKFHALSMQGQGHLVESNLFSGTAGWDAIRGLSANTTYRLNVFTNWSSTSGNPNHPDIIQTFSVNGEVTRNVVFERNLVINCTNTQVGNLSEDLQPETTGDWTFRNNIFANVGLQINVGIQKCRFYNNLFYRCTQNTGYPIIFMKGSGFNGENGVVFNNIFFECGANPSANWQGWYMLGAGITNIQADYNLVVGTGTGTVKNGFQSSGRESNSINGENLLFSNPLTGNFRLAQDNPAVDRGKPIAGFTDDFYGIRRPQGAGWDIGPIESAAGGQAPSPPSNLQETKKVQP